MRTNVTTRGRLVGVAVRISNGLIRRAAPLAFIPGDSRLTVREYRSSFDGASHGYGGRWIRHKGVAIADAVAG